MSQMTALQTEPDSELSLDHQALQHALQILPLELFLEVVEQSSIAISITDPKAHILYCNLAFCRLTGYRRGELKGRNHNILSSQQTPRARYEELWKQLQDRRPWVGRLLNKRKDGSVYLAEVTVTPVIGGDGQITHFLGMHRDISARFALEQRVHNQMALIEAVLNAAPWAVAVLNEENQVVLDNLVYKTLRTDLKGAEPFSVLGFGSEFTGTTLTPEQWRPVVIRGQQRWFSVISESLLELNEEASHYFGEGKRPCTLLIIADLTERREQIEQMRLAHLRGEIEEQKMLAAVSETLDAALVQMQAPLNLLRAALRLTPDSEPRNQLAMKVALDEGTQAMRRLDACRPRLQVVKHSHFLLQEVLRDLQDLFLPRSRSGQLSLQIDIPEFDIELAGQRLRLLTALCLLLERACLLVGIERSGAERGRVRLEVKVQSHELSLSVDDNGPAPEALASHKLLQPFTALSAECSGGIELSLVQSIITDHKGVIEVSQSELGGCCIRLRLPLLHCQEAI